MSKQSALAPATTAAAAIGAATQAAATPPAAMERASVGATAVERTPVQMGISPKNIDEGWRLAQAFAKSELVPKNFRGKPEDVLVAIQMGIEIGFAPMQALQSIAVINGRPGVWGDGLLALVMASPLYRDHDEYYEVDGTRRDGLVAEDLKKDNTTAVCIFYRRGKPLPVTRRFTVGQAKKAALLGKEGPWQTSPDRMLAMRARGFAARDAFPDLLRGIRTAEELRDMPLDQVATIDTTPVRRLSETPPTNGGATAPPAPDLELPAARVVNVAPFLDMDLVMLSTGHRVLVRDRADATELQKFVGTDHLVRITAGKTDGGEHELQLRSFAIQD